MDRGDGHPGQICRSASGRDQPEDPARGGVQDRSLRHCLAGDFGVPDLVESGILVNLDQYAQKYEPEDFQKDALYTTGDYYKGSLYGYQTDGDTYVMFYLKDWLENPDEQKAFADKNGYELKVPETWEQLDAMMAHFHRPDKNMFGGALYRAVLHRLGMVGALPRQGFYPLDDDMNPQINNEAGVAAAEELVAASKHLYPGARSNGLFENFEAFGQGDKFCNIGWGGTQKYLNSDKSKVKGKLAFGPSRPEWRRTACCRRPISTGAGTTLSRASRASRSWPICTLYACSPGSVDRGGPRSRRLFRPVPGAHYKIPRSSRPTPRTSSRCTKPACAAAFPIST